MTDEPPNSQDNGTDWSQDGTPEPSRGNMLKMRVQEPQEPSRENLGLMEFTHRTALEDNAFKYSIIAVFLLYVIAMVLAFIIVCRYANTNSAPDWHISALVGAIIIPPTVILIALIGATYHTKKNDIELPATNYIKYIINTLEEIKNIVK
jgi:hypothetical protein